MRTTRLLLLSLLILIASASSARSEQGRTKLFRQQVSTLARARPESILQAAATFKRVFALASLAERDQGFGAFVAFYQQVQEAVGRQLEQKNQAREPSRELRHRLRACGLVILSTEGMPYVAEEASFLKDTFGSFLSPAYRHFLSIREREMREGFTEDASLLISFRKLGERVVTWELFARQYPAFAAQDQVSYYRKLYLATFLTGVDNATVFDFDGTVKREVRAAYVHVVKTWPRSETGRLVGEYYRILQGAGFRESTASKAFLKARGIESMLGVQPPTR